MNVLCICRQGLNRSRHAAKFFAKHGHETRHKGCDLQGPNPVSKEDLLWAEAVVYAREAHREIVHERFSVAAREFSLDVSDDPANIPELWRRVLAEDPERFYREYSFPRMDDGLHAIQQKL